MKTRPTVSARANASFTLQVTKVYFGNLHNEMEPKIAQTQNQRCALSFELCYYLEGSYFTTRCECDWPFRAASESPACDITHGTVHPDVCWIDKPISLPSGLQQQVG